MTSTGLYLAVILTLFAHSRQFEIGTEYSFVYSSWVTLNEPQAGIEPSLKDVGFKIDLEVGLLPIWQHPTNTDEQLLELKISPPKLSVKAHTPSTPSTFVPKASRADSLPSSSSFYIHRDGGKIRKIFRTDKESISVVNIKKGIASLFQYQTKNGLLTEIDSSGICDVSYVHQTGNHFIKTKTNCQPLSDVPFYNHTSKVLGATISSRIESSFHLSSGDATLQHAVSWESHVLSAQLRPGKGAQVMTRQTLNLTNTRQSSSKIYNGKSVADIVKDIASNIRESLLGEELAVTPPPKECIRCKTLSELVDTYRPSLTSRNLATQSACIAFLKLLRKVRDSSREDIKDVLSEKRNVNILPQLIDIVGSSQTVQAHQAARDVLRFSSPTELPERYLNALARNTHPLESVIEDLLTLLNKGVREQKVYDTMVLSISSMVNTFSRNVKSKDKKIASSVLSYLTNELETGKTQHLQLTILRGMQNLASKHCMETLMSYARISKIEHLKVATQAMRALQTMPNNYFTKRMLKQLERVLFQLDTPHDSSIRTMCLDILLRGDASEGFIREVVKMIKRSRDEEVNTIMLAMVKEAAFKDDTVKEYITRLLAEYHLNNYHTEGHNGLSSAISRQLSDRNSSMSLSFSNLLEIRSGLLKRSTVDVFIQTNRLSSNQSMDGNEQNGAKGESTVDRFNLLNFGIFAGGLSMFGSDEDIDDGEEASAGIEMSVLGAGLRPLIFFKGQGELMGHVWSGTASERTSAFQGSILLQDHLEIILLQNGLTAELVLNGVISVDFAGAVQVSLWNRNAHSMVEVEAASVVQGEARVSNSFVRTSVQFNYGSQSELDFISDLDFYSDIIMCLQMVQQDLSLVDSVRKLESIPGSSYTLRKNSRKVYPVPGKTYVMTQQNTQFCNKMFN